MSQLDENDTLVNYSVGNAAQQEYIEKETMLFMT